MKSFWRKRWHWMAGGGFALLFLLLLSLRLNVFEESKGPVDPITAVAGNFQPARETWWTIFQKGRKIGYAHRRLTPREGGYRLTEEVSLHINTMGVGQKLRFQTAGMLDDRMTLRSFTFDLRSSLFHFTARGEVQGRLLVLQVGSPGEEKKMELPLREPLRLSSALFEGELFAGLQPGESRIFHIFDPAALGEQPVKVSLFPDKEMIVYRGEKLWTWKASIDYMGATQLAWLDDDGVVLREKGFLGITLEKAPPWEATGTKNLQSSTDLTELASLRSNKKLDNPEALKELQVRLDNLGKRAFFLRGGRQTYRGEVVTIRKEEVPLTPGKQDPERNAPYLKPSPVIQSDHPLILDKAKEILSPGDGDVEKARKIVDWVYQNIKKQPVLSVPNALDTLTNLVGDCNEHAVLVAALARAAGIPAQVEAGLVYLQGRFYYHAWNVFYLGDWITADAVLGQMPADVTHIRFIRGGMENQVGLLGLIGRLHLEILEAS